MKMISVETDVKIKVTPSESREIQELCFMLGGCWGGNNSQTKVKLTKEEFLYVEKDFVLYYDEFKEDFDENEMVEVRAGAYIKELRKCVNLLDKGKNKMSWQYGLVRKDDFLYLAEIYSKSSHTESISFGGESSEAIIADLEMALNDLKKNLLVIDEIEFEDEKERK